MSKLFLLEEIQLLAGFLIDDGCHRLGLLSILLWRSKSLMREITMDATSKGGVKLRLGRRVSEKLLFLHDDGS